MTLETGRRFLLIAALALAGCDDLLQEPDTGTQPLPVQIQAVSGDGQIGTAGAPLAQPLRVRLIGRDGEPIPGLWVQWMAIDGSGTAQPRNGFSDVDGFAETTWVLGPASGPQQIKAVVGGGTPTVFDATAGL